MLASYPFFNAAAMDLLNHGPNRRFARVRGKDKLCMLIRQGSAPVGVIGTLLSLRAALVASSIILSPVLLMYAIAFRKAGKRAPVNDPPGAGETTPVV